MANAVTAFGMRHTALGLADLSLIRSGGSEPPQLEVGNIGISGDDGVSQPPKGEAHGMTSFFETGDIPAGGRFLVEADITGGGGLSFADRLMFTGAAGGGGGTPPAPETLLGVEFPGKATVTVELRRDGGLVAGRAFPAPWPAVLVRIMGGLGSGSWGVSYRNAKVRDAATPKLNELGNLDFSVDSFFDVTFSPVDVAVGDGPPVLADAASFILDGSDSRDDRTISGFSWRQAGGSPSFTISSISLMRPGLGGVAFPGDSDGNGGVSAREALTFARRSLAPDAGGAFTPEFAAKAAELWKARRDGGYSSSSDAMAPNSYNSSRQNPD